MNLINLLLLVILYQPIHSFLKNSLCSNRLYRFMTKSPVNMINIPDSINPSRSFCRIKVIGVGGGGGNAVNRMMESSLGVSGVEFWIVNTDMQALSRSMVPRKLNIGAITSRYL